MVRTRRRRRALLLILVGVLLIAVGLFLALRRVPPPARDLPPPAHIVDGPFPSPGGGAETMRIRIPSLGVDLPVVEGDGWTVPLFQAAHYPGMKQPGEGGRSLIYAHAQTGMFGPLLRPGATVGLGVQIMRPGKSTLNYAITKVYPKWSAGDGSILKPTDKEELVLLTCTTYDPNDPRVVDIAEPVP